MRWNSITVPGDSASNDVPTAHVDPGGAGGPVQAAGIGVPLLERGQHDLPRGGVQGLRRGVVEVRRRVGLPGPGGFGHTPNVPGAPPATGGGDSDSLPRIRDR